MKKEYIEKLIKHHNLSKIKDEGVYINRVYTSDFKCENGLAVGSSMIGLYSPLVNSISCFHRLTHDELWHFYGGDPLDLYLLNEDGTTEKVVLGTDFENGERLTYLVKANTWQGGCTKDGGEYSLFGCTVFPEFDKGCFTVGDIDGLIGNYPEMKEEILKLRVDF